MSKGNEIIRTNILVKEILETDEMARNNDNHLIIQVYDKILKEQGVSAQLPFALIFNNLKEFHLPQVESITRERRRCQELYPNLRADYNIEAMREENEKVYEEKAWKMKCI